MRLTWSWARGWSGLAHEDWRYVDLRTSSNDLGELLFWWGLWLFGVMLDRRSLERRPGYADVIARVPALVPRRPRR